MTAELRGVDRLDRELERSRQIARGKKSYELIRANNDDAGTTWRRSVPASVSTTHQERWTSVYTFDC